LFTPHAVIAMNYRHAYHAGNFADVLKHTVLLALIEAMRSKPTPFCVIETHAGSGRYALDSYEAGKTGEYKDGIARLLYPDIHGGKADAAGLPPLLRRWLDAVVAIPGNEEGLKVYPGSPLQIAPSCANCSPPKPACWPNCFSATSASTRTSATATKR
jgi:23S rRNA (adenine2030-N6)-methyltransferase